MDKQTAQPQRSMDSRRSDNPEDQDATRFPDRPVEKPESKSLEMPVENPEQEKDETNPAQRERKLSNPTKRQATSAAALPPEKSGRCREALVPQESQQPGSLSNQPTGAAAARASAHNSLIYAMFTLSFRTTDGLSSSQESQSSGEEFETGRSFPLPEILPPTADPVAVPRVRVPKAKTPVAGEPQKTAASSSEEAPEKFICPNCGHRFHGATTLARHIRNEMRLLEASAELSTEYVYGTSNFFRFRDLAKHIEEEDAADTGASKKEEKASSSSESATLSAEDQQKADSPDCQASQAQTDSQEQKKEPWFKCNCCESKRFPSAESALAHIQAAAGRDFNPPVDCPLCLPKLMVFFSKSSLWTHLQQDHKSCPLIECRYCSTKFKKKKAYKNHLRDPEQRCSNYNEGVHTGSDIIWHLESHYSAGSHRCSSCKRRFQNRIDYYQHRVSCHTVHCYDCYGVFNLATELGIHIQEEHEDNKKNSPDFYFRCPVCFKMFQEEDGYFVHLQQCGNLRAPCVTCGATFETRIELLKHILSHNDSKRFTCVKCSKSFSSKTEYDSHAQKKHKKKSKSLQKLI